MVAEPRGLDDLELEPDAGYIPRSLRSTIAIPETTREKWHREVKALFRPSRNGYNDTLSHLFLIDTLMRLKPDQIIRAAKLRDLLTETRPQMLWDSVTVGRILTELADLAAERTKKGSVPVLSQGKDRNGTYFTLTHGTDTYQWLASLRDIAQSGFTEEMEYLGRGLQPPTRQFSVFDALTGKQTLAMGGGMATMMLVPAGERCQDIINAVTSALGIA
jgi:hypothetical protein